MLGGRYRLEDLLSEHEGARFWRATDTVLARSVAIHALASSDSRAPGVLEAARTSARVRDPHFLRVLDCDDVDGLTWVVNEWGEGASLDLMLERNTLPPTRAAWLAREVAEAIASAHAQGLVHGRLNPEAVLVTDSGAVKVIGFNVTAAFAGPAPVHPAYGAIAPREADVIDVAGVLYAALTGRWPGVSPSSVPSAPRDGRRPLRPRQVRAGVPRTLDAICDRVLNKDAAQHTLAIETAHEIAAALSDYVGDPATAAPVDVPSMYDEPVAAPDVTADHVDRELDPPSAATPAVQVTAPPADPAPADPAPADPAPADPAPGAPGDPADPDATMAAAAPIWTEEYDEPEPWQAPPPPPPLEDLPERPLFADHERRVPPGAPPPPTRTAPAGPATGVPAAGTSSGTPAGPGDTSDTGARYWPFEDADDTGSFSGKEGRSWLRLAALVALVIGVLAAMFVAFDVGRGNNDTPAEEPTTAASTPAVTDPTVPVVAAQDFDPEGEGGENHDEVGRAIDGDPSTGWRTLTYRGNPQLGGLKSGVGLVLDLGSDQEVGSVQLTLVGAPTDLELYATAPGFNDPPAELADARRVAGTTVDGTSGVIRLDPKVTTRYLVVWLTRLPAVQGGYRGEIAEVAVRG
jgi:serine/threonine protein kinase